jgi:hypothetical protein
MRVYDLSGNVAFETTNCGRRRACRIVRRIPGVAIVREPKLFGWLYEPDEFCEFTLDGVTFKIWEPFGDNSRYWVGPVPTVACEQLAIVRAAFAAA